MIRKEARASLRGLFAVLRRRIQPSRLRAVKLTAKEILESEGLWEIAKEIVGRRIQAKLERR